MSKNPKNLIEQMQSYDPQTQQGLQKLILFINKLPQISQSFKVIKKLYLKYGLAIMIYLKPYYDKLNPTQQEIYDLKILAGIAQEMVCNKKITELQFIYKFGVVAYKKQVKKYDNQIYFINIVEQLSKLNSQFLSNSCGSQEKIVKYKQKINQLQQQLINNIQDNVNDQAKLLMKSTFKKLCLNLDQLCKKQIKNVQDCSEILHQLSWGLISQTEQSLFGNFYDHQRNQTILQKDRMLCCRKLFYKDEYLGYQEDLRTTFLQINYPFSELSLYTINRTICSMLNCQGGKIYIGILKHQTGIKQIQTNLYTQNQKQEIFKWFRRATQKISPQIFTQKLYYVQFIPICDQNQQFIPGANIIRITVSYGIRNEIYSYENDGFDYFTFRNNYDIIQKQGRNLLQAHRSIIIRPLPIPIPEHLEPCEKPEIGQPLHTKYFSNKPTKQTKYISKQSAISDRLSRNLPDQTLQKQLKNKNHTYSATNQGSRNQNNKENMGQNGSHYIQATKKQNTQYSYFYVVGLDEKHLIPIFIEKQLMQNIKIQSNKQHRLVVRVHGVLQTSKTRKILKKIQERYYNKNIKVYQMSQVLEIDKNNFNKAIKLINNIQLAYKIIDGNYIVFKLFGESLRAFIELQSNKLSIRFILSKEQQLKKIVYSDLSSKPCFFKNY